MRRWWRWEREKASWRQSVRETVSSPLGDVTHVTFIVRSGNDGLL